MLWLPEIKYLGCGGNEQSRSPNCIFQNMPCSCSTFCDQKKHVQMLRPKLVGCSSEMCCENYVRKLRPGMIDMPLKRHPTTSFKSGVHFCVAEVTSDNLLRGIRPLFSEKVIMKQTQKPSRLSSKKYDPHPILFLLLANSRQGDWKIEIE